MNFTEWKTYLKEQGVLESEIKDIMKFYDVHETWDFTKNSWEIKKMELSEAFVADLCQGLRDQYNADFGDFMEYYISDYDEFTKEFVDFLSDRNNCSICLCPSTHRIIFFTE